jgi:hypothetical protein
VLPVPLWTWPVVLVGVAGLLTTLVAAVPRRSRVAVLGVLAPWVALVAVMAADGWYVQRADAPVPWIGPTLVAALVLGVAGLRRVDADPAALTATQVFRVVGGVFLALLATGHLPAVFALPAGLGDVAIGLAAPVIARRLRRGDRRGAAAFHLLGIADLAVAVATGFLAAPGPYGLLAGPVSTAPMTVLPLVLVPTVLVPLSIAVHVAVLRDLRAARRGRPVADRPTAVVAP